MQLQASTLIAIISALSALAQPVLEHAESHHHHHHHASSLSTVEAGSTEHDLVGADAVRVASRSRMAKRNLTCQYCGQDGFVNENALRIHIGRCTARRPGGAKKGKGRRSIEFERRDGSHHHHHHDSSLEAVETEHDLVSTDAPKDGSHKRVSKRNLSCEYCGESGFVNEAALRNHINRCTRRHAGGAKKGKGRRSIEFEERDGSHHHHHHSSLEAVETEHDLVSTDAPKDVDHKRVSKRNLSCQYCGETGFVNEAALRNHINRCTKRRPAVKGKGRRSIEFEYSGVN